VEESVRVRVFAAHVLEKVGSRGESATDRESEFVGGHPFEGILSRVPNLAGIQVEGLSIGGIETCLDLPNHKIAFDIGRAPDFAIARDTILFTHARMDHLGGVAWHCATRALRQMAPPRYVIGPENAEAFRELFDVWRKLDRSKLPHELIVIGPGDEWALAPRRFVRPFRSIHRAPCQGYTIWNRTPKLAAHLRGLPQAELDAVRASGEPFTEIVDTCEVAFCGDTLIDVLEREPTVRGAKLLILECTFLDERVSVAETRAMGHVHLDEIAERAELFENEAVLLTHFSARYTNTEIVALLDRKLPPHLRARVTPLLRA
jgi:ribonuclease Z